MARRLYWNRRCPTTQDCDPGCDKCMGRDHDLVARTNAQRFERKGKGIQPIAYPNTVLCPTATSKLGFETTQFITENPAPRAHHSSVSRIQVALLLQVAGFEVKERNTSRHGYLPPVPLPTAFLTTSAYRCAQMGTVLRLAALCFRSSFFHELSLTRST